LAELANIRSDDNLFSSSQVVANVWDEQTGGFCTGLQMCLNWRAQIILSFNKNFIFTKYFIIGVLISRRE